MSYIPSIVEGEASESDSEESLFERKVQVNKSDNQAKIDVPHGIVIVGEASESEDEMEETSIKYPVQADNTPQSVASIELEGCKDSLLMKKLSECNLSLRKNILNLVKTSVQKSLEQLTDAEKLLVNSQMRVQRASGSVKTYSNNSSLIVNKLQQCSSYLPNIIIPEDEYSS